MGFWTQPAGETPTPSSSGMGPGAGRSQFLRTRRGPGSAGRPGRAGFHWATNDRDATVKTFPEVGSTRVVISGDRATLAADGTLRLLGWDSPAVPPAGKGVRRGGRRGFAQPPGMSSTLVVGRESALGEWWPVVAPATARMWDRRCTACAPTRWPGSRRKDYLIVDRVQWLGNGKADYRWAKRLWHRLE